jgi:hypothetical protein
MEKLLTQQDINEITKTARTFPIFDRPIIFIGQKNYKTLIGKSPKNGLIMIEGNDDTGFRHIQKRHAYKYEYKEWKKDTPSELDYPTVFPEGELLFQNWHKIVDAVYKKENFDLEKNNDPDKFDLFFGDYQYDGKIYKCVLLLYKNTKIIQTFYLKLNSKNKVFNKKKPSGFHFVKRKIKCISDYGRGKQILDIPYFDNHEELKYLVKVEWDMVTCDEIWRIIIDRVEDNFIYVWKRGKISIPLNERLQYITVFGLEDVEKEIGEINKFSTELLITKCKQ